MFPEQIGKKKSKSRSGCAFDTEEVFFLSMLFRYVNPVGSASLSTKSALSYLPNSEYMT